jgi:hypothetical protein
MTTERTLIISYDGTPNDEDALALGKMLAPAGFTLALAYVRHSREFDDRREELAQHDAEQRLARGAELLGDHEARRHVVISASTGEGLGRLAETEGALVIVFGSDYRTAPGHVEPGSSAQHLLDGGSVAVAVPLAGPTNNVARQVAESLAADLGARLVDSSSDQADLIVVGSQPDAPPGRIVLGGDVRSELNRARASILVLPAGTPLVP